MEAIIAMYMMCDHYINHPTFKGFTPREKWHVQEECVENMQHCRIKREWFFERQSTTFLNCQKQIVGEINDRRR